MTFDRVGRHLVGEAGGDRAGLGQRPLAQGDDEDVVGDAEGEVVAAEQAPQAPRHRGDERVAARAHEVAAVLEVLEAQVDDAHRLVVGGGVREAALRGARPGAVRCRTRWSRRRWRVWRRRGGRRRRAAPAAPPPTSVSSSTVRSRRWPPSAGSAMASTTIKKQRGRQKIRPGRAGGCREVGEREHRDREDEPGCDAAGQRDREAEREPVQGHEREGVVLAAQARDLEREQGHDDPGAGDCGGGDLAAGEADDGQRGEEGKAEPAAQQGGPRGPTSPRTHCPLTLPGYARPERDAPHAPVFGAAARASSADPGFGYTLCPVERALFLSGNEAIAHGTARARAGFVCGYPGTPSTEILETAATIPGVHAEWCVNEKVALETAVGASLAGVRSLVTMKHVGLNVAADPFMTLSLTGVNAGVVVVSADDPGMHSSQNEQDNRNFARFAKVPMLEPADSQEAYDFVAEAFALSEEFDTPVLLRSTTRLSHGRGRVVPRVPVELPPREYARDIAKYVMVPQYARRRNKLVLDRLQRLRRRSEESPLNVLEAGTVDFGIIASGVDLPVRSRGLPQGLVPQAGHVAPASVREDRPYV